MNAKYIFVLAVGLLTAMQKTDQLISSKKTHQTVADRVAKAVTVTMGEQIKFSLFSFSCFLCC